MAKKTKLNNTDYLYNILLAICLAVLTLRLTNVESLGAGSLDPSQDLPSEFFSTLMSFLILVSLAIFVSIRLFRKKERWIKNHTEWPVLIFSLIAILVTIFASERRASVNSSLILLSGFALVNLISQSPNRAKTTKIVMLFLFAVAVVNIIEGFSQLTTSNQYMIDSYENNPDSQLATMSISADTLEQFLYEHRLYSRDIKGFFTNGNSMGSFALLCFFPALSLLVEQLREKQKYLPAIGMLSLQVLVLIAMIFMASSKGTMLAFIIGLFFFSGYFFLNKIKIRRKNLFFIISGMLFIFLLSAILYAGIFHTLPGGNSMVVRGQYWFSALRMLAANIFGVGADNFRFYYPQFKMPGSIETVVDPHNFLLSIACQFGLIGAIAFLLSYLMPMWKLAESEPLAAEKNSQDGGRRHLLIAALSAIVMLVFRPILIPVEAGDDFAVCAYVSITMFILPALIFFGWALFMDKHISGRFSFRSLRVGLVCSIIAFLSHNFIDFAIFEPGNFLAFSSIVGLYIISCKQEEPSHRPLQKLNRAYSGGAVITVSGLAILFAIIPTFSTSSRFAKASARNFGDDSEILSFVNADFLSGRSASLGGRLFTEKYRKTKDKLYLDKAEECFAKEVSRNRASFKPYEKLAEISEARSKLSSGKGTYDHLEKACEYYRLAIYRYPGKAELHISYALCLKQLGRREQALAEFKAALEIENLFQKQFKKMYPDEPVVSRIGKDEVKMVEDYIKQLSK